MDEEDIEQFKEELSKADKVWSYVMDISGSLIRTMSDQCSS